MFLLQANYTSYNFSRNLIQKQNGSNNSLSILSMNATNEGTYSCSQRSYDIYSIQSNVLNITLGKIGSILLCLWTSSQCIVCIKDYDSYHLKKKIFRLLHVVHKKQQNDKRHWLFISCLKMWRIDSLNEWNTDFSW